MAVGDEPAEVVKARIAETFADWRNPTPAPARAALGQIDYTRAGAAKSLSDPHVSGGVTICRYSPKRPHRPEDVEVTREGLADRIWASVFSKRMVRLARQDKPPFLGASGRYSVVYRASGETCFTAASRVDDWRSAMEALSGEIRRLETYGITQREFDETRRSILAGSDAAVAAAPTQDPDAIVRAILDNMVEDNTFDTHAEARRVYGLAFEGLDPASVKAQFHRRWIDASPPLLMVSGPTVLAEADIRGVWDRSMATRALPAPVDPREISWAYAANGAPGKVVSRRAMKELDFTRITFDNGVVLNLKPTKFSRNDVEIHVTFGAGQQEAAPADVFDASMVGNLLFSGGYKRNDINDVMALCEGHRCNAGLNVNRTSYDLHGSTRTQDLDLELQILKGLLTEPGFRPSMASAMPTVAGAFFRQIRLSPAMVTAFKFTDLLPRPHVMDLPSEAHIAGLTSADFARIVEGPLTSDPLEVTMVGDVEEAQAIEAVARTFGALPPRAAGDRARSDAIKLRLSNTPPAPQTVYHEGPKDQAMVTLAWPLFVWTPDRMHESRVSYLMTRILQDAVTERIRQRLGKSYAPNVGESLQRGGDQGVLEMIIQTSPDAADAVQAEALKIAAEFRAGDITDAMLEQARRPLLEAVAKERTYNSWWVEVMDGSYRYPEKLISARDAIPETLESSSTR